MSESEAREAAARWAHATWETTRAMLEELGMQGRSAEVVAELMGRALGPPLGQIVSAAPEDEEDRRLVASVVRVLGDSLRQTADVIERKADESAA